MLFPVLPHRPNPSNQFIEHLWEVMETPHPRRGAGRALPDTAPPPARLEKLGRAAGRSGRRLRHTVVAMPSISNQPQPQPLAPSEGPDESGGNLQLLIYLPRAILSTSYASRSVPEMKKVKKEAYCSPLRCLILIRKGFNAHLISIG